MELPPQIRRNIDLPPSDSDSDDSDSGADKAKAKGASSSRPQEEMRIREVPSKQPVKKVEASSSEEDSSDESENDLNEYLRGPNRAQQARKEEKAEVAVSAKEAKMEMRRLEEIRAKREADRLKRIAADGWDRFAPVTETNKPPVVPRNKD